MIYTLTLNPAVDREYRVPELGFNAVLRASETRSDPGGKGFNVSRMLAQLEQPTTAIAFAGGKAGEWLEQELNERGIATHFVWLDGGETRTNTTIVADHDHIKVNEAGPQVSQEDIGRLYALVDSLVKDGDWWVLAGSLPPGCPVSIYADLVANIKAGGGNVMLDTAGEALKQALPSQPDWIKPNEVEAADLTGQSDPAEALAWFAEKGLTQVVISLGKDGVLFFEDGGLQQIHPPTIDEQNPIGAGDAFVGGMVCGLSQGKSRRNAVQLGVVCGALAASKPGTDFGTRAEIDALLKDLHV